ncbi:MAG: single-stranded DNA-binding protein [Ruminococcus sp.]|nr:single-stranded DNA-binding protein [Ruminococcus sp.]
MLNRVILMGRITQDLELRQTPNGVSTLNFNVAVDRNYSGQDGQRQADFITCVAWRQQAEFISRYFAKGRMIAIEGNLRTRTYDDKNGSRHYVTEVYVDSVSFTGERAQQGGNGGGNYSANYGSQNQGGYQQGGQQSAPAPQNNNAAPSNDALSIGDLGDFEEVLSDDGVPF